MVIATSVERVVTLPENVSANGSGDEPEELRASDT